MSVKEKNKWITGEEFGNERRRLILAGHRDESAEMQQLLARVHERDEYLWDRFAKPLITVHPGKWAAVSPEGDVIIVNTASEAIHTGTERFGGGNFVYGRLAEFRGYQL